MAGFQIQMKEVGKDGKSYNMYPTNRDLDVVVSSNLISKYGLHTSLNDSSLNSVLRYIWKKFDSYYKISDTIAIGYSSDTADLALNIDPTKVDSITINQSESSDTANVANYAYRYISNSATINEYGDNVSNLFSVSDMSTELDKLLDSGESNITNKFVSTYLANNTYKYFMNWTDNLYLKTDTSHIVAETADVGGTVKSDENGNAMETTYLKRDNSNVNTHKAATNAIKALTSEKSTYATYGVEDEPSSSVLDYMGRSLTRSTMLLASGKLCESSSSSVRHTDIVLAEITGSDVNSIVSDIGSHSILIVMEKIGMYYIRQGKTKSERFITRYNKLSTSDDNTNDIAVISCQVISNGVRFVLNYTKESNIKHRFIYPEAVVNSEIGTSSADYPNVIRYKVPKNMTGVDSSTGIQIMPKTFITDEVIGQSGVHIYKKYTIENYGKLIPSATSLGDRKLDAYEPTMQYSNTLKCISSSTSSAEYSSSDYVTEAFSRAINIGLDFAIFKL